MRKVIPGPVEGHALKHWEETTSPKLTTLRTCERSNINHDPWRSDHCWAVVRVIKPSFAGGTCSLLGRRFPNLGHVLRESGVQRQVIWAGAGVDLCYHIHLWIDLDNVTRFTAARRASDCTRCA